MSPLDELHWARLTATPPSLPDTDRGIPAQPVRPASIGHAQSSKDDKTASHILVSATGLTRPEDSSTARVQTPEPPVANHDRRHHRTKMSHPIFLVAVSLALIALVLQVPKGSLPGLNSRQRALRVSHTANPRRWPG